MCSPSFPWSNPHFPLFEHPKQRRWIDLTWTKNCTISKCPSKAASPSGVAPWRCRLARWNWIILSHSPGIIESFWDDSTCILHVTCTIIYSDVGQWICYNLIQFAQKYEMMGLRLWNKPQILKIRQDFIVKYASSVLSAQLELCPKTWNNMK